VGVGVAVGVFGGLMIIRGTGSSSAAGNDPQVLVGIDDPEDGETPVLLGPPDAGMPEVVAAIEVDAAPVEVTPPEPETRTVTLRFDVSPRNASIEVDGKTVKNRKLSLELAADEAKQVKIVVEANGYQSWTKEVEVSTTDDVQAVAVELEKVSRPPVRRPPRPRDDGRRRDRERRPGGIIDL
jgi:hypothetical protein